MGLSGMMGHVEWDRVPSLLIAYDCEQLHTYSCEPLHTFTYYLYCPCLMAQASIYDLYDLLSLCADELAAAGEQLPSAAELHSVCVCVGWGAGI